MAVSNWLSASSPVSSELTCEVCGQVAIATYALGAAVQFRDDVAEGSLACQCGGKLKADGISNPAKPLIEVVHSLDELNGVERRSGGIILAK